MATAGQDALTTGKRITLAHEPGFVIGRAKVEPSTRTIEADGITDIIEPRMMQVLVALARAGGHVVTRDELVEQCWDGRIVGEDAVNRVLWRLRQLVVKLGSPGFLIETIPRVGYRLIPGAEALPKAEALTTANVGQAPKAGFALSRRQLALGATAVAATGLLGHFAFASDPPVHTPVPGARRFFNQAVQLRGQGGFAGSQQVLAYLREAVRIDPDYADAWGALALQYAFLLDWYAPQPNAGQLKIAGRSAARRALQLAPENADAAAALLMMDSPYGRWNEVETGLRALLARHPAHVFSELGLAKLMVETGRFAEASNIFAHLAERTPSWPYGRWRVADALLTAGRLQEADEQIATGLRLWPGSILFWIARSRFLLISGQPAEAVRFVRDRSTQPLDQADIVQRTILVTEAVAEPSAEKLAAARAVLVALARSGELAVPAMELPFIGDVDLSFEMYEGYFLDRGPWKSGPLERRYTGGLFELETASLRRDPRFMALLREIGLERSWREAGVTPDFLRA